MAPHFLTGVAIAILLFRSENYSWRLRQKSLLLAPSNPNANAEANVDQIRAVLRDLQRRIEGQVIFREGKDWESTNADLFDKTARVWNLCDRNQAPPLAVVEVANEADVQVVVPILAKLDRIFDIPWRIRSGGHSYAGWSSVPNGIILSLSNLNQIALLETTNPGADQSVLVKIGPSVRTKDEIRKLFRTKGLGSVRGWCSAVGVGGYTLGGGNGPWARQYGLGLDQVVAMRIVLANGTVVVVNNEAYADLFWALRGAGQNNFGVVTEFTYCYYPSQDEMTLATVLLNATQRDGRSDSAADVLHRLAIIEPTIPGQVGAFFNPASGTDGAGETLNLTLWHVSKTQDEVASGKEMLRKVFAQLPIDLDSVEYKDVTWTQFSWLTAHFHDNNMVRIWNGFLFPQHNTLEACQKIVNNIKKAVQTSPHAIAVVELWGGAMSQVDPAATAFYWRRAVCNVRIVLLVPANLENAAQLYHDTIPKFDSYWTQLAQLLNGTYINYASASLCESDYARATYGGHLERLQALKKKYDPENVFRNPHSIPLPGNNVNFASTARRLNEGAMGEHHHV